MTRCIQDSFLHSAKRTHMLSSTGVSAVRLVAPAVMKCCLSMGCTLNVHHWCWLFDLTVPLQSADWHLWHDQEVEEASAPIPILIKNKVNSEIVLYNVLAISWMDKHDINLLLTVHKPKIVITHHSPQHPAENIETRAAIAGKVNVCKID